MSVKDKLQIILITYNRSEHVEKTLRYFLNENSPLKDYDFLVLDNNSSDNTYDVIKKWQENFSNIKYQKNNYNLGISGNIAKAMEVANKDYVWIIGDDDNYDFTSWQEVETAINNDEKVIVVARYTLPDSKKNNYAEQLLQLTFITGGIYKTSIFTDTTMRNAFDNIYTLFPHLVPVMDLVNAHEKLYVVDKAISDNGTDIEKTDCSYTRGATSEKLYPRSRKMSWIVGYANICSIIKDKKLRQNIFTAGVKSIHGNYRKMFRFLFDNYNTKDDLMQLIDIYMILPFKYQIGFLIRLFLRKLFHFIIIISKTDTHRTFKIFGIKIRLKRKNAEKFMKDK